MSGCGERLLEGPAFACIRFMALSLGGQELATGWWPRPAMAAAVYKEKQCLLVVKRGERSWVLDCPVNIEKYRGTAHSCALWLFKRLPRQRRIF